MTALFDITVQAQVDRQLLEQGAFTALEWLIDTGRLLYSDYERWRSQDIEFLDGALMGNPERIRAQLEQALAYAQRIGLTIGSQEFLPWRSGASTDNAKPLRISADAALHQLISGRYIPAQQTPQLDLFFDNPVVALIASLSNALADRDLTTAHRCLDQLYAKAPNHADLGAFDQLVLALQHIGRSVEPEQELEFLLRIAPLAKRLLGARSRDLLIPLWRQLAAVLRGQPFAAERPDLHASYALGQAQDWAGASAAVHAERAWWLHPTLCLRLTESSFYQQRRAEALTAWCHLCWRAPEQAAAVLSQHRQPDPGMHALWQQFLDCEDDYGLDAPLPTTDFPAWLLLTEPGLVHQLPFDLPTDDCPGEQHYRWVHQCISARLARNSADEIGLRKLLQQRHPQLFQYLKQRVQTQSSN